MNCFPIELFADQKMAANCRCQIGGGVLNNPVISSCGHNFCHLCIQNSLDEEPKCPICREDLALNQLIPSINVEKLIEMLEIKCKHHNFECPWVGETSKFPEHLNNCEFTPGRCKFCSKDFKMNEIKGHVTACPQKPIECEKCGQKMILADAERHKAECSDEVASCERKCGRSFKRKFTKLHLDHGCLLKQHKCVYESLGCPFSGTGKELEEHLGQLEMKFYHQRLEVESQSKFRRSMTLKMNNLMKMMIQSNLEKGSNIVAENAFVSPQDLSNFNFSKQTFAKIEKKKFDSVSKKKEKEESSLKKVLSHVQNKKISDSTFEFEKSEFKKSATFKTSRKASEVSKKSETNQIPNPQFSMFNKGDDLFITNNLKTVTNRKSSFQIAILKKKLIPDFEYRFKIEGQNFGKFCIGLVDINKIQGNNFNMRFKNHSHGCYFIRNNGDFLVDGRANFFIPPFNLHLKNESVLVMKFVSRSKVILFETEKGFQQSVMEVGVGAEILHPAVMVYDSNKKISIL